MTSNCHVASQQQDKFLYLKAESVNLSEFTISLTDAVKILLFWYLLKLGSPYRSKSLKAVS